MQRLLDAFAVPPVFDRGQRPSSLRRLAFGLEAHSWYAYMLSTSLLLHTVLFSLHGHIFAESVHSRTPLALSHYP